MILPETGTVLRVLCVSAGQGLPSGPPIATYIDGWNDRAHPFTWTKNAENIIAHAKPSPNRKKTYDPRH